MTDRENVLRAVRFECPDHIPMIFHINAACWHHYDQDALQDLMERHRLLFPRFERKVAVRPDLGVNERKDAPYTDPWGCRWETTDDGITGTVRKHPLADWANFDKFVPPDSRYTDGTFPVDWLDIRARVEQQKRDGATVCGGLPHGHTFLRLSDIRGYENLLVDMVDEDPRLARLITMVNELNHQVVMKWLALRPDMLYFPDDLGMQLGPMLSPDNFRTYIKPLYSTLMKPARDCGCIVHMHSDGDIRSLLDDILECGVDVINLQDSVNGIEWIAHHIAGRVCIDLDIDRQHVTPQGTPQEIDSLIREEVSRLGSKQGGLMMIYGLYPGVPIENVNALMDAMERYATFYS
jgi:hypothetical protein